MYVVALVKKFPIQDRGKQNQTKSKQYYNCGNIQKQLLLYLFYTNFTAMSINDKHNHDRKTKMV